MAFIFNNISIHLRRFLPQHCGYYYKHLPNPSDHEILIPHLRLAAPVFVGSAVPFSDELYHQCYLSEIPVSLRTKALCTARDDVLLCRLYAYDHTFHSGVLHQPAVPNLDNTFQIVSVGKHPGLVLGKVWIQIQESLERNKSKSFRKPRSNEALLTGLLFCSCGERMYPKMSKRKTVDGKVIYTYVCKIKERSQRSVNNGLIQKSAVKPHQLS